MRRDEDCIILLAEDDGLGLIVEKDSFGFGMRNLKARIEQLNGVLQVNSSPLEGTVIRISIPNPSNSLKEPHFHENINLLKG
jgi:signal transduction histidine kinase